MIKYFKLFPLICTALISANLSAAEPNPSHEIRISLPTTNPLTPIYIAKFSNMQSGFSADYLNELETILVGDFKYNGTSGVLPFSLQKEELLNKDQKASYNVETWKQFGVPYVIKGQVSGNQFSAKVLSVQKGSMMHFENIELTGTLSHDRRQMHKLADSIYKSLFDQEGVAGTRILYSYQVRNADPNGSEWVAEIWECDWDGSNARQVTKEKSTCVTPVFVPGRQSGDKFLYVSYKQGQPKIFIASLKDGSGKRFVDIRGSQLLPAVSKKRDKVAFISDAGGRTDLFLQALNPETGEAGKPVQLFSYPRSTQASPTFSPDGSKLAFVSDKDGSPRIYVISTHPKANRENPTMISKQNSESSCPSWSPDGAKLAYSAKTSGIRQIWIYDFGAREERQLTFGPGNKENPCWAPNSSHLVFNSTDGPVSDLYVVNLNQPEVRKITHGAGKKHYPSWGAR